MNAGLIEWIVWFAVSSAMLVVWYWLLTDDDRPEESQK